MNIDPGSLGCWLIAGPVILGLVYVMLKGWPLTRNQDDGS